MRTAPIAFTVFTGTSGSGKSSALAALFTAYPKLRVATSVTTGLPRGDELPGEYMFVNEKCFSEMKSRNLLAWSEQPHGSGTPHYGATLEEVVIGLTEGNRLGIFSCGSLRRLFAIAKARSLEKNLCHIHFQTEREEGAGAKTLGLPYHLINAMLPDRLVQAHVLGIVAQHPAFST